MHFKLRFLSLNLLFISLLFIHEHKNISFNNLKEFMVPNFTFIVPQEKVEAIKQNNKMWFLTIPRIGIDKVEIEESVDDTILENYIGHFSFSSFLRGNVCLAAHNAGFKNNFFKDLYQLEIGDEIIYSYYGIEKIYEVESISEITDEDFSLLYSDKIDRLTLVTCISGAPSSRLCVKAVVKEEDND